MRTSHFHLVPRRLQRGITIVEFMVSIAIGMIVVAALATLIADQSSNRAEVDRAGRLIESGRYSARVLADELQMAGYWGEISLSPAAPAAWADPCGANPAVPTQAEQVAAMGLHITGFDVPGTAARPGYNGTAALPALAGGGNVTLSCLPNLKPGTDVLVVRHADSNSTPYENGSGVPVVGTLGAAANGNRLFTQAGLNPTTSLFETRFDLGANAATAFELKRKDKVTMATVRRFVTRIYYVSTCSVCSGTPDAIPSLKMLELDKGGATAGELAWADPVTISEGVENLQVEYGFDAAATKDGAPDGADIAASSLTAVGDWAAVVSVKLFILARSIERSPGFTDAKSYPLGLAGAMVPAAGEEAKYKRHVFSQSVRLVNPSFRRSL
ncbi:MAG TPA: PilW family protein [Ramlibacter sp.]|uniref:PilW family protein n=1 Tax=Ramlibacter sp. TaxID=1917967 RepID=UPI002ED02800